MTINEFAGKVGISEQAVLELTVAGVLKLDITQGYTMAQVEALKSLESLTGGISSKCGAASQAVGSDKSSEESEEPGLIMAQLCIVPFLDRLAESMAFEDEGVFRSERRGKVMGSISSYTPDESRDEAPDSLTESDTDSGILRFLVMDDNGEDFQFIVKPHEWFDVGSIRQLVATRVSEVYRELCGTGVWLDVPYIDSKASSMLDKVLGIYGAASYLGMTPEDVLTLVRTGKLVPMNPDKLDCPESLRFFHSALQCLKAKDYFESISLHDLCHWLKLDVAVVGRCVRDGIIKPCCMTPTELFFPLSSVNKLREWVNAHKDLQ